MMLRSFLLPLCCAAVLGACQQRPALPADLPGRYEVQQIAEADLAPESSVTFTIDASGAISGSTGCNPFTAQVTAFSRTLTVHTVTEQNDARCSAAQQTDETRFLQVLPHITRFGRDEHRVVFFGRTPDQVLLLTRRED